MHLCYVCLAPDAECKLFNMKSCHLLKAYEWLSDARSALSEDALICSQCATLLKKCLNLRNMCRSSHKFLQQCTQITDENIINDVRLKNSTTSNLKPAIRETLFYKEIKANDNLNTIINETFTKHIFHKLTVNITEVKTDEENSVKTEIKSEKYSNWDDMFSDSDDSIGANEDTEVMVENKKEVLKCEFDEKNQSKLEMGQAKPECSSLQANSEIGNIKTKLLQNNVTLKSENKLTKSEILKSHYLQLKRLGDSQKKSPFLNLLAKLGNSNNKLSKPDNMQSNTQPSNKPSKLKQNVTIKSEPFCKMQSTEDKTETGNSQSKVHSNFKSNENQTKIGNKESKLDSDDDIKPDNTNLYDFDIGVNIERNNINKDKKYSTKAKNEAFPRPTTYMCEQCGHIAITKKYLKEHYRTHTANSIFKCNICEEVFKKKILLIHHIRRDHSEKPSFLCQYCSYLADNKGNLRNHERKHTGEKPFKCNVCNKCFGHKGTFDRHSLIHTGERPFKCSICVQAFRQKICLVNHMRTHTGERPFKCHMCTMAFSQSNSLKNHINTHTGMKPYTCSICDRSFAERGTLSKHIRTHKSVAPCAPSQLLAVPQDKMFRGPPGIDF